MKPLTPPLFTGHFKNLATFCWEMNAVPFEGGVAAEELERLRRDIDQRYQQNVKVQGDFYAHDVRLTTLGDNPEQVAEADRLIRKRLDTLGARYDYEA